MSEFMWPLWRSHKGQTQLQDSREQRDRSLCVPEVHSAPRGGREEMQPARTRAHTHMQPVSWGGQEEDSAALSPGQNCLKFTIWHLIAGQEDVQLSALSATLHIWLGC